MAETVPFSFAPEGEPSLWERVLDKYRRAEPAIRKALAFPAPFSMMPEEMGQNAMQMATLPQRLVEGSADMAAGGLFNPVGMEAAMTGATGAMPFAGKGNVGIFGGRLAATADKAALARAEDMAAKGTPREDIWRSTGWFQGPDGKWRFEIPDAKARLGDRALQEWSSPRKFTEGPAAGVLWHKDLYDAYPQLRRMQANASRDEGSVGFFVDRPSEAFPEAEHGLVFSEGPKPDVVTDVLLHEMQHAVQKQEGFPRGGSPGDRGFQGLAQEIRQRGANEFAALQNEMREWQTKWIDRQGIKPTDMDYTKWMAMGAREWKKAFPQKARLMDLAFEDMELPPGMGVYKRLAGEVEARNVQKRMSMTPAERKAAPPWTTEDVPQEQQIIRFGSFAP